MRMGDFTSEGLRRRERRVKLIGDIERKKTGG